VKQEQNLDGSAVVSVFGRGRRIDILYSLVYLAFFGFALNTLYTECKTILPPSVAANCPKSAAKGILTDLTSQWQKDHSFFYGKYEAGVALSLLRADVLINVLLAPVLALVMLRGAKYNNYKFLAHLHGIVTALVTLTFLSAHAIPKGDLSRLGLGFFFVGPVLLLWRWSSEWPFSYKTMAARRSFFSWIYDLLVVGWLLFSAVQMYDWAVSSHKDLKTLPKVGAAAAHAQKVAAEMAADLKVEEKAEQFMTGAKAFAVQASDQARVVLADLGDKVRDAWAKTQA